MELRPRLVDLVLSLHTSQYASGDVIAEVQEVANAVRDKNVCGLLKSLQVIDEDDQGAAFDIYFFDSAVTIGAENGAPDVTDAEMRSLLGIVSVATADYKDVGGSKVASYKNIDLILKPGTDSTSVWIGVINGAGTPTYTASGMRLRLGVMG